MIIFNRCKSYLYEGIVETLNRKDTSMQVYVCIKHVPDTAANIKVIGPNGFDESVKFVLNPYDEYAIEEAIQVVKKAGGEVVVISVGKAPALNSIRSALAMGADRGILIKTDDQFLDSCVVSRVLKTAIDQDGHPDLIFTGKQSVDSEGMQTHYRLAAAFELPVAADVVAFDTENGRATVECELGGGDRAVVELTLPCVIAATKGLNQPRYPKLPDILKAKKKEVKQIDMADLQMPPVAACAELLELIRVPDRGRAQMLQGSTREMVEQLVHRLKDEEKVL